MTDPCGEPSWSRRKQSFVRMYEHHAAIEDTTIFPAWKAAVSPAEYAELGEQFEVDPL